MKVTKTDFEGLLIFEPTIYEDDRGLFYESFNQRLLNDLIPITDVVQENISSSKKNVLRGLHFQIPPHAQSKLVTVIKGAALDVVVDLRKDSSTFGQTFSIELNEKNRKQMYIPRGFAHGFLSLEEDTLFSYKCDNGYHKDSERTIKWNDHDLDINWNVEHPILSVKDAEDGLTFKSYESPF